MTVTYFHEMTLFKQDLNVAPKGSLCSTVVKVAYLPPDEGKRSAVDVPLEPSVEGLEVLEIDLHGSGTKAYNMGEKYNSWFSSCFGYEVMLAYLGPHLRPVLGNLSPNAAGQSNNSWFSALAKPASFLGLSSDVDEGITFADVAPYLVITEESLQDVSSRLPEGEEMDVTKFRPNIVLSDTHNAPYEEDFWSKLTIRSTGDTSQLRETAVEFVLTQNCARCKSLNVDYNTGKVAPGETGQVLKKLMKDRRVDKGTKYSPVFGRYGFLNPGNMSHVTIAIGDDVMVTERNSERTTFSKPMKSGDIHLRGL